jgi:hypothetical protein
MRTIPLNDVLKLARDMSRLVTANYIAEQAQQRRYTYDDYKLLALAKDRVPMSEIAYITIGMRTSQLELEGIS